MIEFGDFRADSLSSKPFNGQPVTLEGLEETRQLYLDAHPETQMPVFPSRELESPPVEPMALADHIVGRF
ncbi:MAG: hypothetical protein AAB922_00630 [Patescibacteria group bacterium]